MKLIIGLMAMLLPLIGQSQEKIPDFPKVGDILPNTIAFHNVINYKSNSIDLSDLRGKLVILDFWSTYCTTCIQAFPHLDSLQKKYGDQVQILLIIQEAGEYITEKKIKAFISNFKKSHSLVIPIAITSNDSTRQLFPHTGIPHYVWIDPYGRILAKTMSLFVAESNIETALADYRERELKKRLKKTNHPIKQN